MQARGDEDFVERIERNAKRYQLLFAMAADKKMPEPTVENLPGDTFDVLNSQVRPYHTVLAWGCCSVDNTACLAGCQHTDADRRPWGL